MKSWRMRLSGLGLVAATALLGCSTPGVAPSPTAPEVLGPAQRSVQQYEGGTGVQICWGRYWNCVRTLRYSLGRRSARRVCRERRATCINALGTGYFYRGGGGGGGDDDGD